MQYITLSNGVTIPQLGLGVFRTPAGETTINSVRWALEAGYRHIDTAMIYHNEEGVGIGMKESGVPREEIFLTTKLWTSDIRGGTIREGLEGSLKRLQTDYVDLYLIHWAAEGFENAWLEMEKLYGEGKIRAIGVSNFHKQHMVSLRKVMNIVPMVNQIESQPYFNNQALIDNCLRDHVDVEVYSPLGGTGGHVLEDETLAALAEKYGKTPAQIVIRWHLQRGLIVLPKSTHKERIVSNLDVFDFELTAEDMKVIGGLDRGERAGGDPDTFCP